MKNPFRREVVATWAVVAIVSSIGPAASRALAATPHPEDLTPLGCIVQPPLGPGAAAGAPPAIANPWDLDHDGLSDDCEQALAERYAPIVFHSSDESNYPTNVDWHLRKTSLRFYDDDCFPDLDEFIQRAPTQSRLIDKHYTGGCDSTSTIYSGGTRSLGKHRTFFLADVADRYRKGSLTPKDWTTYVHAYPNDVGGVSIQYWRFYPYNDAANNHGGDWEGVIVVLDPAYEPTGVIFLGHTDMSPVPAASVQWEGTHPYVFSEGGGHASHETGDDVYALSCAGGPARLSAFDRCTSTRQETWTGGQVAWCKNSLRSACRGGTKWGGRLVNLGSKAWTMNGQVFVKYSGLWGSPGTFFFTSGYWGPAYNETGRLASGFLKAWCVGMSAPQETIDTECHPAAESP